MNDAELYVATPIQSELELRALHAAPSDLAKQKSVARLDRHCRDFIALSPFLVLGTAGADGRADVSPRGDPPGFVKVLDDTTLLIPERPGNNLLESLSNLVANPEVGLLFLIPGFDETLRINGRAELVRDPALLAPLAVDGKLPKVGIRVAVREAYLHCARSFRRAPPGPKAARGAQDAAQPRHDGDGDGGRQIRRRDQARARPPRRGVDEQALLTSP